MWISNFREARCLLTGVMGTVPPYIHRVPAMSAFYRPAHTVNAYRADAKIPAECWGHVSSLVYVSPRQEDHRPASIQQFEHSL